MTISDLNDDVVTDTRERITTLGAEASGARQLESGTLLFSFKLTIGKMAVAGVDLYTNEAIAGLVPSAGVQLSTEYLRHALSAVNVSSGASHAVKGRTLNLPLLRAITIPLPPLPEQMRIVATLREELDAAARMRAAAEDQMEIVRQLEQGVVDRVFKTLGAKWPARLVGEFVVSYRNGFGRRPGGVESGPIVLRIADVSGGRVDLSDPRRGGMSPAELATYSLVPNDLLFIRVNGSRDLVGRCILVEDTLEVLAFNDHLIRVRLDGTLDPQYVRLACEWCEVREHLVAAASTSAGQLTVNQTAIASISLPVPPLSEQTRIVGALRDQLDAAARMRAAAASEAAELGRLPAALLRRAFLT